ncbi:Hypothetical protein CINCED_3A002903 [Cinara cedri]|uniref:Galectin n=1 Tax=Cinara cedri TaxID=506608 RepID=A0A5E4ND85_9HEMI|nr:Hypothetical protein CINCED_3A002903 [Cinara cedri]
MAQARFLNPIMPFMGAVLSGSEEGSVVRIHGSSFWTSNKICIYFQTDSEVEPRDDVALYIALDFNRNLIIRNSMMAQIWGLEETQGPPVSLVRGQPFNLDIICDVNNYKILFNGVFHAEMKHRIPCINDFYLVVDGDALLYSVQINDIGLALPGQIPIPSHLLLPEQMQYLSEEMPIPEQMHLPEEMPIPEQMHLPEEMAILEQMDFSEEMPLLEQMHYLSEDMPIPEQIHLSEEMPIPQQMIYLSEEMPGLPGQISKPTMFMCVPAGMNVRYVWVVLNSAGPEAYTLPEEHGNSSSSSSSSSSDGPFSSDRFCNVSNVASGEAERAAAPSEIFKKFKNYFHGIRKSLQKS